MGLIETPEFWSAFAFIVVILLAEKPLRRALDTWGKQRAKNIQNQIDEAQKLLDQAQKLRDQYEQAYTRRGLERQKLVREAETEIRFLETEALEQSSDRMRRKNQEVDMRLQMIAEHGRHDIKHQILERVVHKAEKLLVIKRDTDTPKADTDRLTDDVCGALDSFETVLK